MTSSPIPSIPAPGHEPDLPEFRFDARHYDAEVERAERDRNWEWQARTVARLLNDWLRSDPDRLGRWQFELGGAWSGRPDEIDVLLFHPRRPNADAPWLQFRKVLTVTDEDPSVQAERIGAELTDRDPRSYAEICGGSAEFARELGFEWPSTRR